MKKYNETKIMGVCIVVSCVFLLMSVLIVKGVKVDFLTSRYKAFVKGATRTMKSVKKKTAKALKGTKKQKKDNWAATGDVDSNASFLLEGEGGLDNVVRKEDIAEISKGRVLIRIPRGVSRQGITVSKDLLHRRIVIQFPKGTGEYDASQNVNQAEGVSSVECQVSEYMVTVTIAMSETEDCFTELVEQQLVCEFFLPAQLTCPVVVIDAGHGGYDVGAVEKEIYEKDIDLKICQKLRELFVGGNVAVYYTRLNDSYPTVEERVDFSNAIMPELFISIHANWYEDTTTKGCSVLYNIKDEATFNSKRLSEIMSEEVAKVTGMDNRGVVEGNDIHIVRHSAVPVALLETGFMSNEADFKVLTSAAGQDRIALGIFNGIIKALTEMGK